MTEIRVTCLLDRSWDPVAKEYSGREYPGSLLEITTQSKEDHSGEHIPVGVVALDDGTFQSVPLEFIQKITN